MDFKTRKKYYNLCDPYEPLEPDDERNVDLDAFGEENRDFIRGVNWTDKLVEEIVLSDKPAFKLFTGLPGSGKTTELKRLIKRLSDPDEGNLFPVFINAEEVIDLSNPIEVTDIITAVVYATEKAIIEQEGGSPEKALDEGYFKRLWNWLQNTDVEMGKGEFAIPSAGKLVFEMKSRPTLRQRIREDVTSNILKFVEDAKRELEMRNYHVTRKFEKDGIVIIFDSLERLRGITSNWHEVLTSAEKVFRGNASYVRLPVHVLYTVPSALATRIRNIVFLPMIKVRAKDREPYKQGLKAALELIHRRVPDAVLGKIFGPDVNERIEKLLLWSGGYPREIVQMLQKAIAHKTHPLPDSALDRIIADIANEYLMIVSGETFDWLAKVAKSKVLTIEDDEHRRIADIILANHAVLRYLNKELWYDLHPAVYEIPGVQKAIANLEAGEN